ncbi:MFS transporter [Sphingobium sp. EM0848]|uniref:MFS transporter n=1 Tax=Sphingobium sp. EM0848 TaxID=2743473 RepID=UPI002100A24A|nr:MFS transporter [Sphingobium sp. EM0848]
MDAVPDGLPAPRRHWALIGLWIGMAMSVIDAAIVNIALPLISWDLHVSASLATWVVTAYQIAIVMTLLPVAALGERIGYHRVYLGGLVLFTLMSLGCAVASGLEMLAVCRFAQGLGAAAMMGVNGAQMRFVWPKALLGRGIGYNAVVISGSAAAGPVLAGLILSFGNWPWLFLINLPLGLIALVLGMGFAPQTPSVAKTFDWKSALFNAVMFGALFLAASDAVHGDLSFRLAGYCLLGGVAGMLLIRRERSRPRPLIPFDLMAIARLRRAYGASVCAFVAQMGMLVSLPFLLVEYLGLGAATIGLLVLPFPIGIAIASPVAGRLARMDRGGAISALGLCLMASVLIAITLLLPARPPLALLMIAIGFCGIGFGLFQPPNNLVMLTTGPMDRAGAAAGMLSLSRLLGQTAGALIAALVLRLLGPGSLMAFHVAVFVALAAAYLAYRR